MEESVDAVRRGEAQATVVRLHLGMTMDEAATEAARLFGFRSTSARLKQILQNEVRVLLERSVFESRNGKLYLSEAETKTDTS